MVWEGSPMEPPSTSPASLTCAAWQRGVLESFCSLSQIYFHLNWTLKERERRWLCSPWNRSSLGWLCWVKWSRRAARRLWRCPSSPWCPQVNELAPGPRANPAAAGVPRKCALLANPTCPRPHCPHVLRSPPKRAVAIGGGGAGAHPADIYIV